MKLSPKFARSFAQRDGERGVTMLLVAVGLSFIILAIAALAIDLVALYSAHNDARLAADAAALAGAKAVANSGYTTDQGATIPLATVEANATSVAKAVGAENTIGGQPIPTGNVAVSYNTTVLTDPQVTVTITGNNLPAFFSRIWGKTVLPVAAASVAEAYNPSGYTLPVQSQCVKPWLLPNLSLTGVGPSLFNVATGTPTVGAFALGASYKLSPACTAPTGGCAAQVITPAKGTYIFAQMTAPATEQACAPDVACAYEQNISSCSPQPVACGPAGSLQQQIAVDTNGCTGSYATYTNTGTSCLIHQVGAGLGAGQDCMGADGSTFCSSVASTTVTQIFAGANNRFLADGIKVGDLISTSDSLVTIPVYDSSASGTFNPPTTVNIIGFVQGFITQVDGSGNVSVRLVNISGCGSGVSGTPVQGDGISPVPVHLIAP